MATIGIYVWGAMAVVVAALILVSIAVVASSRRRRTEQLQILFGPEYDRAVDMYGDKNRAEEALENRRKLLEELGVHELSNTERKAYLLDWMNIQSVAPNDPAGTLIRADKLLTEIMRAEGCPAEDAAERRLDLALMHPMVGEEYRAASGVIDRMNLRIATQEECRRAVIRFANIFDSILGESDLRERLRKAS